MSAGSLAIVVFALALACCSKPPPLELHTVEGDGFTLAIPKGYATKPQLQGLRIYAPERERSRSPVSIVVTLQAQPPRWTNLDEKELEGRTAHYAIDELEGGSGGVEKRLRAWMLAEGRYFVLESSVQPDSGGDGDFRAEWAILPTARFGGAQGL